MECIFCKIIKGEIPASKIFEDKDMLCFLDILPINKGHVLVIPKKHAETVLQCDSEIWEKLMGRAKVIVGAIKQSLNPDGINIFVNNGKAAGQEVPHLHIHVVPRFRNDEQTFKWKQGKYDDGEMLEVSDKIKKALHA